MSPAACPAASGSPTWRRRCGRRPVSWRSCWPTTRSASCRTWPPSRRSPTPAARSCTRIAPRRWAGCRWTSMRWGPTSRASPRTRSTGRRGPERCTCVAADGRCGSSRSCSAAARSGACGAARSTCRESWGWRRRRGWRSRARPTTCRGCGRCGIGCGTSWRAGFPASRSTGRRSMRWTTPARPCGSSTTSTSTFPAWMAKRSWPRSPATNWP